MESLTRVYLAEINQESRVIFSAYLLAVTGKIHFIGRVVGMVANPRNNIRFEWSPIEITKKSEVMRFAYLRGTFIPKRTLPN